MPSDSAAAGSHLLTCQQPSGVARACAGCACKHGPTTHEMMRWAHAHNRWTHAHAHAQAGDARRLHAHAQAGDARRTRTPGLRIARGRHRARSSEIANRAGQECVLSGAVCLSQRLAHSPHCHRQNRPAQTKRRTHGSQSALCASHERVRAMHHSTASCRRSRMHALAGALLPGLSTTPVSSAASSTSTASRATALLRIRP